MIRRDTIVLLLVFGALVAFIGLGPGRSEPDVGGIPSSHASRPEGALALYRWLAGLGYNVERLQYQAFTTDPEADLLVVLAPVERYTDDEAEVVRAWVEAGGTLLVAEERPRTGAAPLLEVFGLALEPTQGAGPVVFAPVLQPVLGAPPVTRLEAGATATIATERDDLAVLAGAPDRPVLVGLQYGAGYVYASSTVHPFTNAGLHDDDNAAAVLNLLRRVEPGGRVIFDEIHHGFVGEPSLRTLLLGTPWGWAILYAAVVGVGYLAFTGRRFGRPIPLRAETARRSSAEYLESMAGLLRRAGKSDYLLEHYRATFRRRLARAYGLSPDLDDATLVAGIAVASPSRARAAADLLARMAHPMPNDTALIQLVAEGDALSER